MIERMRTIRLYKHLPVLQKEREIACENMEKAEMLAKNLLRVHSSYNLSDEGKVSKQQTLNQFPTVCEKRNVTQSTIDVPFTIYKLRRALSKCKRTVPGKDSICYCMLANLSDFALERLLVLYNKVWKKGQLPVVWKEAVIIPIKKPRKDPTCHIFAIPWRR